MATLRERERGPSSPVGVGDLLACDAPVWQLFSTPARIPSEAPLQGCRYCGGARPLDACDGYYTCEDCGALVERIISTGAEWRYFGGGAENAGASRKDPSRCGMPFNDLMPNSSYNLTLAGGAGRDCRITKKYHMWNTSNYRERIMYHTFETMSVRAAHHGITSAVVEEAKALYKRVSDSKIIIRGDNRVGIIASCIYMSCKMHKVPRSTREVAKIFDIDHTLMTRGCKILLPFIDTHLDSCEPLDFVGRFASRLSMSCADQMQCKRVVATIEALGISTENTPPAVAAAGILLCQHWWPSQQPLDTVTARMKTTKPMCETVASVSGISAVTVSKCFQKLLGHKDVILKHIEHL